MHTDTHTLPHTRRTQRVVCTGGTVPTMCCRVESECVVFMTTLPPVCLIIFKNNVSFCLCGQKSHLCRFSINKCSFNLFPGLLITQACWSDKQSTLIMCLIYFWRSFSSTYCTFGAAEDFFFLWCTCPSSPACSQFSWSQLERKKGVFERERRRVSIW